ncbi:MAG: N-acyl-D-amino-acid deacylase family protein [Lutispora sp.]|jgi:N-acyl-D-amino-acid deacylase
MMIRERFVMIDGFMYDLIIKNARIIDGTNAPWFRGDVGIKDGRIERIGILEGSDSKETVDAEDQYLVPGFIDIHCHSDSTLFDYPLAESRILQGITTELGGNCGISPAPVNPDKVKLLKDYAGHLEYDWGRLSECLGRLESEGTSTNFGTLIGHGTIRLAVMGFEDRKPTEGEMEEMVQLLRQAMDDGAYGMSSGLIYPPGCFSDVDEMAELVKVLKSYGGFYATHMRDEATKTVEAVKEALEVCKRSGVPLEISHHKVIRKTHWELDCKTTVAMIEKARREGLDVTVDQYPYNASSTTMDSNVPLWGFEGGMEKMLQRLQTSEIREQLKAESNASHVGRWGDIFVSYAESEKNAWTIGKSIAEIAEIRSVDPADACFDLIVEEKGRVNEVNYGMCEEDIEYIMSQRFTMIGSDGYAASMDYPGLPHPRWYGTFPRVIAHYCRDRRLFPLETAIYKMTGLPAARLGLPDRGLVKEGMWSDLVLLDFENIQDTPDYNSPKSACKGILKVYVNGVLTAENGVHTGAKSGKILRKGRKGR